MKLNKLFIALGVASMAFASCENELVQDVELDIAIETNNNVQFDGKTITVKQGTPIPFKVGGDPDFLTFFSGEAGKEYRYKDRVTVEEELIASSKLKFTLTPQYGKPAGALTMYISSEFPGMAKNAFEEDSVLVEQHAWETLIPAADFPTATKAQDYEIDMSTYIGKRISIAICYDYRGITLGPNDSQTKFTFNNMMIQNTMTNDQVTSLSVSSFGFTPLNMLYKHNLQDQANMTSNRAYGTVTNNTSGIWNVKDWNAFFIHSSGGSTALKYSWLVSDLFVVNGCTPDAGTAIKSMHQSLSAYNYTYNTPGTYTATFVATNGNYKQETSVVKEYTIVVTE